MTALNMTNKYRQQAIIIKALRDRRGGGVADWRDDAQAILRALGEDGDKVYSELLGDWERELLETQQLEREDFGLTAEQEIRARVAEAVIAAEPHAAFSPTPEQLGQLVVLIAAPIAAWILEPTPPQDGDGVAAGAVS